MKQRKLFLWVYGSPHSVGVGSGDHLGEINNCGDVLIVNQDVELVKVAVYEPVASQLYDQLHQYAIEGRGVGHAVHLGAVCVLCEGCVCVVCVWGVV